MVRLSMRLVTAKETARWHVGLDDAGDDIDRRALGGHDQMDAGRATLLAEPLDQNFDFLAGP